MTMPHNPSPRPAEGFGGPETLDMPGTAGPRAPIREMKDQVLGEAKNSLRQARDSATSSLTQSRLQASERIGGMAAAIRKTSDHLRSQNEPRMADLTETLADQAERLSSYVRDRDLRGFQTDIQNFARRRPGVAVGAAVAVGLLAARFFKSSRRPGTLGLGGAR